MLENLSMISFVELFEHLDGQIHWEASKNKPTQKPKTTWHWTSRPNPANIEMTAYGLMTYISGRIPFGSRLDHFKIVKWLVSQRNPHGGFGSTQVSKYLQRYTKQW